MNNQLEDLFYNRLNLEDSIREILIKKMHPFDNMKDYIKYGDNFIRLELNPNKNK